MAYMLVTLEVSKLSGWLNANASCRGSKGRHIRCGVRYAGRQAGGAAGDRGASSVRERARLQIGGRARGGAHVEHDAHVRDAGGVEAQRLVERPRGLPRVEIIRCGARYVGRQAGGAAGDRGASSVQGRARLQIRGRARGGAHPEHVAHVRDAGGVEAQRLVERLRALPRVERRAYTVWREVCGSAGGWGGGRPRWTRSV